MSNPYLDLTDEFNQGRLRALLSSGQAVVVHRLAIMSKDGDWILREDAEALRHVLEVLSAKRAQLRFGAPLDLRWLAGGWSSHLEFRSDEIRMRTDFVTRPPRIGAASLARMWAEAEARGDEVVGVEPLAALKLTNREKDYVVIGELARLMTEPRAQLRYSRSSRDLIELATKHPEALAEVEAERPLLRRISEGREALDEALDQERRTLIRANEARLDRYLAAARAWREIWPDVQREIEDRPLAEANAFMASRAEGILPFEPASGEDL